MKANSLLLLFTLCFTPLTGYSQDSLAVSYGILPEACPPPLAGALNTDTLKTHAALFFINDSSHPLGRLELKDEGKIVRYLKVPIRMRRITLVYIQPGTHRFQTIYMRKSENVNFEPGRIYIAGLITTSVWPVPYAFVKEDRVGREYVPVLLYYITPDEAVSLLQPFKNKEVIVNP